MNKQFLKKPFCKVCYDTGKSEEQYTSHYVKDVPGPKGIVVCPTLLTLECRYCKKIGHTVSKCPIVGEKRRTKYYPMRSPFIKKTNTEISPKKNANPFDALNIDEDVSDDENVKPNAIIPSVLTRNPNSYADVLKRELVIRSPSTSPPPRTYEPHTPEGPPPNWIQVPRSPSTSPPTITKTMNWADMVDSDDENSDVEF